MRLMVAMGLFLVLQAVPGVTAPAGGAETAGCPVCGSRRGNAAFTVQRSDGSTAGYGCAGCALRREDMRRIVAATAVDRSTGREVEATEAYYVVGGRDGDCCEPHWVTFAAKEDAERYVRENGGELLRFPEAAVYALDASGPGAGTQPGKHPHGEMPVSE